MLFITDVVKTEELNTINNFFTEYEISDEIKPENVDETSCVSKYISSLVSGCYRKSVEDIENTKVGNKIIRKRSLSQVMQESFFYGANRFGNNFIA